MISFRLNSVLFVDGIPTKTRLPLYQLIIYAFGYYGVMIMSFSVAQIPLYFYAPPHRDEVPLIAPLTIAGVLIAGNFLFAALNILGRVVDGFVDPWIGNISDHFRSRFGRRKPFLVIGAPLMAIFLVLFTVPPSPEPSLINIPWLAVIYPLFFLFFTIAITPYLAMIPEITTTPADRLLVTTLQAVFLVLGTFTAVLLVNLAPQRISYTTCAMIVGVLSMIPFFLVAAFVNIPEDSEAREIPPRPSTLGQIRSALAFTPFRIYLISQVAFWFGFKMIENGAKYIAEHLIGDVGAYVYILGTALGVATIFGIVTYWLGRKLGKRRSMILMCILFAILLPLLAFLGKGPLASPIACYIYFGALGVPLSILLVIPNSLLADIIDRDTERTGEKREALFFASQALINKIGVGFSKGLLLTLVLIGAAQTPEGQAASGELGTRLIGPIAAFFVLIGLLVFLKFPDVEKRE